MNSRSSTQNVEASAAFGRPYRHGLAARASVHSGDCNDRRGDESGNTLSDDSRVMMRAAESRRVASRAYRDRLDLWIEVPLVRTRHLRSCRRRTSDRVRARGCRRTGPKSAPVVGCDKCRTHRRELVKKSIYIRSKKETLTQSAARLNSRAEVHRTMRVAVLSPISPVPIPSLRLLYMKHYKSSA